MAYLSRFSLRVVGSHGFYRFFAWECMLILLLLNVKEWFNTPLAWHQLISWLLLSLSLIVLMMGAEGLIRRGKPGKGREDETHLFEFERTSQLVESGIYRYIRHPLYSSLFWLSWGIFFKQPGWIGFFLSLAASFFLYFTAKADEAECIQFFGAEYTEYMKRSKRFLPFVF
ncbi:MAG TPA: isoprenylcysteine carboxylmethyltransferase family protein [bacterium]|nr:isoprenylcysteine carboxylmethyltransferase family protein [bacterium]HQI50148.1 isoprenylcysteine carboxylmethyltransferase family protein [bacterium]HQJ65884.1 isoprenylcysteine carboxylmethyltransferase family protein [bacterium]